MAQWAATAPAIHCLCIVSFQERWNVDVIVTEIPNENSWGLTDQLGRDMGRITLSRPGTFMIRTAATRCKALAAVASKPYASLDIALAAIEEHTGGMCRRARK